MSLWRDRDFVRLWSASTISIFGSLITRTALPFAAILVLAAGPIEIAALRSLELVGVLLVGLIAGAWVDRLRRRPIMVGADLGRVLLLATIPAAALLGALAMPQLYAVAFLAAILTTFFDVADRAFLPTIVPKERLLQANSALTASASVAEFGGFGIGGFLIQLLSAPFAIAVDAATFVVSAVLLGSIRGRERERPAGSAREPMLREIREGLRVVVRSPVLSALTAAHGGTHLLWGIFSTSYLLFATREIGLGPAAIGVIAGLGGVGSFVGAAIAGRATRRLGVGPTILLGLVGFTVGNALIPLAPAGAVVIGAALFIVQQLVGDSAGTTYEVVETSLVQSTVDDRLLGRVNATSRTFTVILQLAGTVAGGIVAEAFGLRAAFALGLLGGVASVVIVWFSPIRSMRAAAAPIVGPALPGEEVPLTE